MPLGGAAWAVLKGRPFEKVSRGDLAGAAYSTGKLSGALLRPGTVVALRTRDGRYAKLKVVRYRALYDFSFPEAGHLPDRWRRFALSKPYVAEYHLEVSWVLYGGKE